MTDVQWTLWIFAGPSLAATAGASRPLPLDASPAGVQVFAEAIGEPTLLQQLTDEWPARRLSAAPGQPPVESTDAPARDLTRFIAWAEQQTLKLQQPAKESRRALIVLGDVLRATGAAAAAPPPGGDRPPYPGQITIKKKTAAGPPTILQYAQASGGGDAYAITPAVPGGTTSTVGALLSGLVTDDEFSANATGFNKNGYRKTAAGDYTDLDTDGAVTVTDDGTQVNIDPVTSLRKAAGSRSLDAVGVVDVDPATRRIDALAAALRGRTVDLLISDEPELVQLAALRRLAPHATVLLGPTRRQSADQPLVALLAALRAAPTPDPATLAAATLDRDPALLAYRGAAAVQLTTLLDTLAGRALAAGAGSPLLCAMTSACRTGGDLARLGEHLAGIDDNLTRELSAAATRAHVRPRAAAGLGFQLDAPGLQPGPRCEWTRMLDAAGGDAHAEVVRRTLADVQAMQARTLATSDPPGRGAPLQWLEYDPAPRVDFSAAEDFAAWLATTLADGATRAARHLALVVRGASTARHPASVTAAAGDPLAIAALARHVREALARHGRGPLAILVLDDPALLSLEVAYELRDIAAVLLTGVADRPTPTLAQLRNLLPEPLVRRCERAAADALRPEAGGSVAVLVHPWRRDVACRMSAHLVAPDHDGDAILDADDPDDDNDGIPDTKDRDDDGDGIPDAKEEPGAVALQGVDLRHIEALCRRFDRLCRLMQSGLQDDAVLAAVRQAATADSVIALINRAQMQALATSPEPIARDLNLALGGLYNWISGVRDAVREGGAPFWIDPRFVEDRSPGGYCTRLRVTVAPHQPRDYRALAFHQDIRLHAMLAAGRLLDAPAAQRLWGLVSLGLDYASSGERGRLLGALLGEPTAAHYFAGLGEPPRLQLDLEEDGDGAGYELRLSASESAAVLMRQRSVVDLATVDRALEGLGYVLSRGAASVDGWRYLEAIGAGLAEDIVHDLRSSLERERAVLLAGGRSREAHLALALPRTLMRYPWELMRLPPTSPGERGELLAERFALGRQMWSDRELRRVRRDDRVRVLIVADPLSDAAELPGARAEARAIQALCEAMGRELGAGFTFECDASIGEAMTRTLLRELVRDGAYDVLHFAGHGTYASQRPETSGWLLSDGLLTVTELRNTLAWSAAPPWLIYANACSAGMVGDGAASRYDGEVHGMAEACIRAGVDAYLAPLWKIHDESARLLATEFYRRLLLERATLGTALHGARAHVRKTWETVRGDAAALVDISWAGLVLFGNPTSRLHDSTE